MLTNTHFPFSFPSSRAESQGNLYMRSNGGLKSSARRALLLVPSAPATARAVSSFSWSQIDGAARPLECPMRAGSVLVQIFFNDCPHLSLHRQLP